MSAVDISDKLYTIRYKCDDQSHLTIKDNLACLLCTNKYCNYFCPSDVYGWDSSRELTTVAYENCIECGTCRIACPSQNIEWVYPKGGYGIAYKFG